jgi:D-aminoacyl-tRNA deacylase
MRCVVQRVLRAAVTIRQTGERRQIGAGLMVLVGVHGSDTEHDASAMAGKVAGLRIFSDHEGKMNLSVLDLGAQSPSAGECLVVSQFTLYGDARRGKRPSFIEAAQPSTAIPLYERFAEVLRDCGVRVKTGEFGADMLVEIENDGPVTILLDSTKLF